MHKPYSGYSLCTFLIVYYIQLVEYWIKLGLGTSFYLKLTFLKTKLKLNKKYKNVVSCIHATGWTDGQLYRQHHRWTHLQWYYIYTPNGDRDISVDRTQGDRRVAETFLVLTASKRHLRAYQSLAQYPLGIEGLSVNLTSHLEVMPRLGMHRTILPFFLKFLWCGAHLSTEFIALCLVLCHARKCANVIWALTKKAEHFSPLGARWSLCERRNCKMWENVQ